MSMTNKADDWVNEFFTAADTFVLENLAAWFADDIEVRFGNQPALHGKQAATQSFKDFWAMINGMRHQRQAVVLQNKLAAQMSIVTYVKKDGQEVSMPVASHLRLVGHRQIDRLWIFIDMAPLFAE